LLRLVFQSILWQHRYKIPMRKSREVPITLLAAAAMLSIGCHDEPRHCVDDNNRLVPDSTCDVGHRGGHFVYGGSSGWHVGDAVVGSSVSRGGFGGGEGGEGGHGGGGGE
jgi:hypothetical protein